MEALIEGRLSSGNVLGRKEKAPSWPRAAMRGDRKRQIQMCSTFCEVGGGAGGVREVQVRAGADAGGGGAGKVEP